MPKPSSYEESKTFLTFGTSLDKMSADRLREICQTLRLNRCAALRLCIATSYPGLMRLGRETDNELNKVLREI